MKISSSQVQSLLKVYGKTLKLPNQSSRTEGGRLRADNVTISGEGKLMQKAIQVAHLAEDIRQIRWRNSGRPSLPGSTRSAPTMWPSR